MKVSGLKLAVYVSLLVHAMALSVIYAVQRAGLSNPTSDAWADSDVLEILVEAQPSAAFSVPVPLPAPIAPSMPVSAPRKSTSPESEAVPEINISELLLSAWSQELPAPRQIRESVSEVSVTHPVSVAAANEVVVEDQDCGTSRGIRSGVLYVLNPKPIYPRESRKRREQGTVILEALIATNGSPQEVCVKRSAGYPLLDEAALRAVSQWRFEPAKENNVKVASRVEIPVRFELLNSL